MEKQARRVSPQTSAANMTTDKTFSPTELLVSKLKAVCPVFGAGPAPAHPGYRGGFPLLYAAAKLAFQDSIQSR